MAKLKIMAAAALAMAAAATIPGPAQAHGYPSGPIVPAYPYPEWGYGITVPSPYYEREYRRAEKRATREFRRQLKREAKAYRKLRRAYARYESLYSYGAPYVLDPGFVPYRLARDDYRFLRRLRRGDDHWDDD